MLLRILTGILFDRPRCAAIRVAFAEPDSLRCPGTWRSAPGCPSPRRSSDPPGSRALAALAFELLDGDQQLRNRGTDVRQLDDVRRRQLRQLAEFTEIVGDLLVFGQIVGNSARMRAATEMSLVFTSIPAAPAKVRTIGEAIRRKQRRFVGQRVDDGRLLGGHAGVLPASLADR